MRPTRLGAAAAFLAAFTLFAAGSTGNNLLYLLFAATVTALLVALVGGPLNLRGLSARLEPPDRAFRGSPVPVRVVVENRGGSGRLVRAVGPLGASAAFDCAPGATARVDLRALLPHRGLNRVDGIVLESVHPFGFFSFRRRVEAAVLLALPPAPARAGFEPLEQDSRAAGAAARGGARDGDLFGPRPYASDDDARLIHWKLTAKTGRPVVAERAAPNDGRAIVRLAATDDASIERAAGQCRARIDAGGEVGLVGPGLEVAPGRGTAHLDAILRALALAGDGASPRPATAAPSARDAGPADTRALRRLTLLGGVLVYSAMFLIDDLSPTSLLSFAPLIPLGVWLQEREGPFPPRFVWNALSVTMLAWLALVDWKRSGVALANAHLLGYLLVNRLFSPWSTRELRQVLLILYLAFFLVSGLTISPWYFPLFVAWLAFAGAWLSLQSGADAARPSAWAGDLLRRAAWGVAFGAAVFLAVPRVEGLRRFNPFVASGMDKLQIRSQAVMGFTDRVSLGHFGTLRRSSARALTVRPQSPPRTAALAPSVFVRGAAFDDFDGRNWTKAPMDFRWRDARGVRATRGGKADARAEGASLAFPSRPGAAPYADVEVYPMQVSVVFTVGFPRAIDGLPSGASFDHTDSVASASPLASGAKYRVYSSPAGVAPTDAAEGLRPRAFARALATPPDPEGRAAALAAAWTAGLTDPRAKAEAIAARLRRDYAYSLSSDGLVDLNGFLFRTRRGNCEYFASAEAVLLRHAGVPTRLVTGFRADDWNEWGRFYDVRQSAAHAWVEAWIPGSGWVVFDATPPESGFSAAADEFGRRVQRWVDAFQAGWYRSVIGYDQYSQKDAFLRLSFSRAFAAARDALEKGLGGVLPLALGLGLLWWLGRAVVPLLRASDEYERAERALARAGIERRPDQTAREFARTTIAARPELAPLDALVDAHYRRRWAGEELDADGRAKARAALADLRARL